MTDTVYTDGQQPAVNAAWLNDINNVNYRLLGSAGAVPTTVAQLLANLGVSSSATIAATYLTQANAATTYLTQANAASTYLTQANAATTYAPLANAHLTGTVTINGVNAATLNDIGPGTATYLAGLAAVTPIAGDYAYITHAGTNAKALLSDILNLATAGGLGLGQTWQDVSGSRVFGTVYQNTTVKPISVGIVIGAGPSGSVYGPLIHVSSVSNAGPWVVAGGSFSGGAGGVGGGGSAIIPPNHWYYVEATGYIASHYWSELR